MRVVVCVKQVPNPEVAASQFRVDEHAKAVVPMPGVALVMSPFDEQAVEAALRIRDRSGEVKITAISMGPESARAVVKHALAMGADEGVLLADPAFEGADSYATALALSRAISKIGGVDLVLAGRQAADWDAGVVGTGIAELLGWPVVTFARSVAVEGDALRVERVLDDGTEIVEAGLPAVVTVSNELGAPRAPTLRETMRAGRKPVAVWSVADLGLEAGRVGARGARRVLERLFIPEKRGRCEFVEGGSPRERAANLVRRLREAKLV